MTDISGVVPESSPAPEGAPLNENGATFTNPLGSQAPERAQQEAPEAKPVSLDASLDRAIEKVNAKAEVKAPVKADAKVEAPKDAKPEAKVTPDRGEGGKFVAKQPVQEVAPAADAKPEAKPSFTASEAPARFSPDARAKWAETDQSVRGETERAIRELTEGHTKYKAAAERDASITEYHELAQKHGTTVKDALAKYTGIEKLLADNPVKGLEQICSNIGLSLRDVAAHVLNQKPEEIANDQSSTIRELKQELAEVKKQVGTVSQTFQHQQATTVGKEVADFASAHPRFEELHEDIAFFLKTRCPGDLKQAYELAERLNPAPAQAEKPAASSAVQSPAVQTDKGQKSITGAPTNGSTPAGKKRAALSIDESLDRAFGRTG